MWLFKLKKFMGIGDWGLGLGLKNKFISTIIGTFGFYLGIGFIFVLGYFSIYITSYIHIHQNFVNSIMDIF